jgi:hypothetical protein
MVCVFFAGLTGCSAIMDSLLTDGQPAHEVAEQITDQAAQSSNPLIALAGAVGGLVLAYGGKKCTTH